MMGEVLNVDREKLYRLFELVEDIGVDHDWNLRDGVLLISAGGVSITFKADSGGEEL